MTLTPKHAPFDRARHAQLLAMAADLRHRRDLWASWCMSYQARALRFGRK